MFPWGWGTTKDQGTGVSMFCPCTKWGKHHFLCWQNIKNPVPLSFFAHQPHRNVCYTGLGICWSMIDLSLKTKLIKVSFLSFQTTFDQLYVDNTHSSIIMHVSNKCLKYILKKVWNDERNKNIIVTLMYRYRFLSRG